MRGGRTSRAEGSRRRGIAAGRPLVRLAAVLACVFAARVASAQLRVVTYNVAGLSGNQGALAEVFAALNADDQPGFALAPHVYVFQEVQSGDFGALGGLLNEAAPAGVDYAAGTYTNHNENGVAGAQAMFYRPDALIEIIAAHKDLSTGAGRRSDRWKLRLVEGRGPGAEFYIYSSHLKASQGGSNEAQRLAGVIVIRDDADALPAGTQIIYAGDFNFYDHQEPGYLEFVSPGAAQALDPLGTSTWSGAPGAVKHTQSPRAAQAGGLAGGGMDDRFDFQLLSASMLDDVALSLIPGAYRAFGNDGVHYNAAINSGDNYYYPGDVARSNALADALHAASDHLPVVADYLVPSPAGCATDVNADGTVDVADLVEVILAWGPCTAPCPADVTGDLAVDVQDVVEVISGWGRCP